MSRETDWWLYLLDCDGRLYTGISTDPERRLAEHRQGGSRAARFTRGARELALKYAVPIGDRSLAQRAEAQLRRLPRAEKLAIVRERLSRTDLLQRLGLAAMPEN